MSAHDIVSRLLGRQVYQRKVVTTVLVAGAAVVIGLFIGGDGATLSDAESAANKRLLPVNMTEVRKSDHYTVHERYAGRVISRRDTNLGFDRPGVIDVILVDEGTRVTEGDLLASLDVSRLTATRMELLADRAQKLAVRNETKAQLALAEVTAERQKTLLKSNSVSRQRSDEVQSQVSILRSTMKANDAAVERAEAALAVLEADIGSSSIVAPFSGMIVGRMVDEGMALAAGTPVIRLIEDTVMEVRVGLPPKAAATLEVGRVYDVEVDGQSYPAELRSVLSVLDMTTRTVPAIFEIQDTSHSLRSGQLARIDLNSVIQDDGYWVPIGALIGGRRGLWNAFGLERIQDRNDVYKISRREVQVVYSEANRAFVRGAIKDGDLIVSDGLHRIVPGQLVRHLQPQMN